MKEIPLTQGKVALVEDEDFDRANQFNWYAAKRQRQFYACKGQGGRGVQRREFLHNFILGVKGVDHRDGNGLNNSRGNLRVTTQQQNTCAFKQKRANASSQYRGVSWDSKRKKWAAQIQFQFRHFHLGRFNSEANAASAYDTAARRLFGDFAAPNFPV